MRAENLTTLTKIRKAAKAEFLAKGFKSASLRNIVKTAGLTTGAFYGYYGSKEELFCALVDEPYQVFMERYRQAQEAFACLPPACQQENMGEISGQCMDWMVAYVYENYDAFKLLLCCAEGTKYENMVHDMVEIEVRATHRFMEVLRSLGRKIPSLNPQLEHILVSGMFTGFFEMVVHDMPQEKAPAFVRELRAFYMAGWQKIMGF